MQIHHLVVNALLKSNQLNEMEGGGFDEAASNAPAFLVLKQLIQRCLVDAVTSGNEYADEILQHLYRWICRFLLIFLILSEAQTWLVDYVDSFLLLHCSPQSRLHDPALHRLLHKVCANVLRSPINF